MIRRSFALAFVVVPLLLAGLAQSGGAPGGASSIAAPPAQVRIQDRAALDATASYLATARRKAPVVASYTSATLADRRVNESLSRWVASAGAGLCKTERERTDASEAAAAFTSVYFRRAAGFMHTEVPDLVSAPQCTGDLVDDRLVAQYLEAVARDRLGTAAHFLELIDQQLSCLSVRQLKRVAFSLRFALEYTSLSQKKNLGACATPALSTLEQAAMNLMWRVLEHRLPSGTVELGYLRGHKDRYLAALNDPSSVVSRMRLWVSERARPEQMAQLSAACRTGAGGRAVQFVGASGSATCDPLASVVRSFGSTELALGDCRGGDLEALGGTRPAATVACRASCASLAALGWSGHPGTLGAGPGLSGGLQRELTKGGRSFLGASAAAVQGQCSSFGGGGGGGGIGGMGARTTAASLAACLMSGPATSPGTQSSSTCMTRGLTGTSAAGAASMPIRACGTTSTDGGKKDPPTAPAGSASAAPEPSTPPAASGSPSGSSGGSSVPLDPASVAARYEARRAEEAARHIDERWFRLEEPELSFMAQLGHDLEFAPVMVIPEADFNLERGSLDRFHLNVRLRESCAPDGECASTCTGNDRFSQVFQTCTEQAQARPSFTPPVYPRGGDPEARGNALLGCITPSSVPLPATCPALDCPEGQRATPGPGGTCRCTGSSSSSGGGSGARNGNACATIRCAEGQVPTPTGVGCVCQGAGSTPGLGPVPNGPQVSPSPTGLPGLGGGSLGGRGPTSLPSAIPTGLPGGVHR